MAGPDPDRARSLLMSGGAAAIAALLAFAPFVRGALAGTCFYFRDLSVHFFPLRRFALDGLRRGELRFWNPYVHEGEPLSLPPVSYPLDLLQILLPDERGFSLLLALHVPLAALAFFALARGLQMGRLSALGGACVYALGGFCLSMLNLSVYLQAAAWAPLLVLALLRAAGGGTREVALAAVVAAVSLSTTGIEVVAQALLFGLVLSAAKAPPIRWARLGGAIALGVCLAAPTILLLRGLLEGSERGRGFPTEVVLAHSVHPLTLVQVVVGSFHGDLGSLAERWWGQNFFPRGFPYVLSLYLGPAVLAVAGVGALRGRGPRGRILALLALGLLVSLGRWAGLSPVVDALPALREVRYPAKAFFSVHLAAALLLTLGLEALVRRARGWRTLSAIGLAFGAGLAAAPGIPWLFLAWTRWFVGGFFPPDYPLALRLDRFRFVLADASVGGILLLGAGLVAGLVVLRRLEPRPAGLALVALVAVDLLRAGAGLNPMVSPSFFELSPEMKREVAALAPARVFTCTPAESRSYLRARRERGDRHEVWTFQTLIDTLTPSFNMRVPVRTALSPDLTMLVPVARLLPYDEAGCADFASIADRVRAAGVSHVVSLDPLDHPDLSLRAEVAPARLEPLRVRVYELARPLPLWEVPRGRVLSRVERPGRLELVVEADAPTRLMVREAYARGWQAKVNGTPAVLVPEDGRHRAVPIAAGRSQVVLTYRPPGLAAGVALALAGTAVVIGLAWSRRGRTGRKGTGPGV